MSTECSTTDATEPVSMTQVMDETSTFRSTFDRFEQQANGSGPSWLDALRRQAIRRFELVGFPTTKVEAWRHTNVAPIARTPFRLAAADESPAARGAADRVAFGA